MDCDSLHEFMVVGPNGQDVFVDLDAAGDVLDVYGFRDTVPAVPANAWQRGPHTSFLPATNPKRAFAWLLTNWTLCVPDESAW